MSRHPLIILALLLAIPVAAGWAQDSDKSGAANQLSASVVEPDRPSGFMTSPDYVIGAEDTLHIAVWKEPDFSATLPVRPDGKISLPLLNDVQAAGLTPMQLAGLLTDRLKKFVTDPRVTVVVTQMNSQRIYVLGEVQHTGTMPLLPRMTVLQALATAGFTPFANTKGIYVLRPSGSRQQKIPFNYKRVIKGEDVAQNITLKPGDTIVVP